MSVPRITLEWMRGRIESALQHTPNTQPWRDDVRDRLNDHAMRLAQEYRWPFMVREQALQLRQDRVYETSDDWSPSPTYAGTPQTQAIEVTLPDGWGLDDVSTLAGSATVAFEDVGFEGVGKEFVVERAVIGPAKTGGTELILWLDPRYVTPAPGTGTATLKFPRYILPRDCTDLLGFSLRGPTKYGGIGQLRNWTEDRIALNRDSTSGTPTHYIDSMSSRLSRWPAWIPDAFYQHGEIDPPEVAPTLAPAAVGGSTLPSSTTYEYRYVWTWAGMVSPPSPVAEVTLGVGDNTVNITTAETGESQFGRIRYFFRRKKGTGRWILAGFDDDPANNPMVDTGTYQWRNTFIIGLAGGMLEKDWMPYGVNRFVRVWPRPDEDVDAWLRYQSNLRPVELDSDVFDWPDEASRCVLHRVIADLAGERGDGALQASRVALAKQSRSALGSRYSDYSSTVHTRQSSIGGPHTGHVFRTGPVNWQG